MTSFHMLSHTSETSLFLDSMQNDPVVMAASELFRMGRMPSPEELKAGKVRELVSPLRLSSEFGCGLE
jgi:hypothetical protein